MASKSSISYVTVSFEKKLYCKTSYYTFLVKKNLNITKPIANTKPTETNQNLVLATGNTRLRLCS